MSTSRLRRIEVVAVAAIAVLFIVVFPGLNAAGIVLQAMSWRARRRGDQRRGVALSLAGMSLVGVGGYLGGHLTEVRKVSSHHPAFDAPAGPL